MNSKFTLALIALVGVGVFALPSTMALFAGQHTFYNIDATGNQVPCQKCHGDVKVELSGDTAKAGSKAPHADFKCEYCHRSEAGFASGDDAYAKITFRNYDLTHTISNQTIYLVTTIQNFETGNFPKEIDYVAGMTVDNWYPNLYNTDGTPFVAKSEYNTSSGYAGSLNVNNTNYSATAGIGLYKYAYASEVGTRSTNGSAKDGNTNTQNGAFQPRLV